uniref:Uncharacterized protein n=1 Tax=Cercocebus atys TaxID=9531 RepID=A0A2K5N4U5_CERAT
ASLLCVCAVLALPWRTFAWPVILARRPGAWVPSWKGTSYTPQPHFPTNFYVPWENLLHSGCSLPLFQQCPALLINLRLAPHALPMLVRPDGLLEPAGPWMWVITVF